MPTPFSLTTPLPPNTLRFEAMTHVSALCTLDDTRLQLLGEKPNVQPDKLLGQLVELSVVLKDGSKRHLNGYVTRFGIGRHQGRWFGYQAELRPWLWFLTRSSDCRIFQEQTVKEIVETVFADYGAIANFEFVLTRSYRKRVYCVQYRETDFNFVARLLEDEGIGWFFRYEAGSHKLILCDSPSAHQPMPGAAELPYYDNTGQMPNSVEYVSSWNFARSVKPGKAVLTSYDFEKPSASLLVDQAAAATHDLSDLEVFDFAGDYVQKADGQQLCDDRLDEQQSRCSSMSGRSNAQALGTGHLFKLRQHPRDDQNGEYICAQLEMSVRENPQESGGAATDWLCSFTAMPSDTVFRPERRTPRPTVQGPHTAVVVGPSGEEIYTDKYGRVKVQFHWDRLGAKNEKSSCWVRVSSPWAGKSFGFVQIPRIGQEVVVDFLEGDPDQPIITGRVYNAEQMPPWELPANATQSGVLTRSSKGGAYGNANAIRFEDKKDSEQLWIHAEKNQDIEVENDETHWVGHDRTKTVDNDETVHVKHDRTETVDNNETITIGVDRTESVGNNESISIGVNRTETVGSNESITIGVNRTEAVGSNETITIGSNRSITVGASETATVALQRTHAVGVNETIAIGAAQEVAIGAFQSITVGAQQSVSVGLNQDIDIGKNQSVSIGANQQEKIKGAQSTEVAKGRVVKVGEDDGLSVGKKIVVEAGESITLKAGSSTLVLKKDGTISLNGKDITIEGSGKIKVEASGDMVLKGSKIAQN
jgi:type VI secretion system secreted protein VgrG